MKLKKWLAGSSDWYAIEPDDKYPNCETPSLRQTFDTSSRTCAVKESIKIINSVVLSFLTILQVEHVFTYKNTVTVIITIRSALFCNNYETEHNKKLFFPFVEKVIYSI